MKYENFDVPHTIEICKGLTIPCNVIFAAVLKIFVRSMNLRLVENFEEDLMRYRLAVFLCLFPIISSNLNVDKLQHIIN